MDNILRIVTMVHVVVIATDVEGRVLLIYRIGMVKHELVSFFSFVVRY